ncbi:DNA gyrase inhibitor YacG [Alteromonas sp. ASW11-36]|uniref:DNA gyrase inhibitor YacG n=1 Tax=Alteromonas arenosi TaxID=3055817 RepID=A0ABT7STL6_9ALTE|nr:DNA gyrase inhibitor YacG [Alteromonas sp. ASW11-36]MDM7859542.1 DNA gyrase inhibitor YacG [Alteromonas sp. ASW11-36]
MNVNCPTCQKSVEWSTTNEYRPFCSKKCQLIDLGEWATESHVISAPTNHSGAHIELDEEAIAAQFEQQSKPFFDES